MARRHTPEQVIAKVRQARRCSTTDARWSRSSRNSRHRGDLVPLAEPVRSEKNAETSKRTKELEKENARLKRLLAEKELAIDILNEVAKGKF